VDKGVTHEQVAELVMNAGIGNGKPAEQGEPQRNHDQNKATTVSSLCAAKRKRCSRHAERTALKCAE